MNPEEKELLEKTYSLTKENNEILRGMRRSMRWGTAFRALYWVLIIAGIIGTTVYIGPMLNQVYGSYQDILKDFGGGSQSSAQASEVAPSMIGQLQQILKEVRGQ